jgi:integrase
MTKHLSFAAFADRWLADYAPVAFKPSTRAEYEGCIRNHLLSRFGALDLGEVTTSVVQAYVASALGSSTLSPSSVRNHLTVLRTMFAVAQTWGLIEDNPVNGVVGPRATRADITFLSPSEMRQLIEAAPGKWRALIAAACLLGLRKGELLALRWADVDFTRATVRVSSTVYRGLLQPAKTSSSVRTVPLPDYLAIQLQSLRNASQTEAGFVFSENGMPLDARIPNRVLARALRSSGLKPVRFHDLRHSFVAAHIAAGTPVKVIQQLVGHASVQTTMDVYGHLIPGLYGQAATAIESVVFGKEVDDGDHQA